MLTVEALDTTAVGSSRGSRVRDERVGGASTDGTDKSWVDSKRVVPRKTVTSLKEGASERLGSGSAGARQGGVSGVSDAFRRWLRRARGATHPKPSEMS